MGENILDVSPKVCYTCKQPSFAWSYNRLSSLNNNSMPCHSIHQVNVLLHHWRCTQWCCDISGNLVRCPHALSPATSKLFLTIHVDTPELATFAVISAVCWNCQGSVQHDHPEPVLLITVNHIQAPPRYLVHHMQQFSEIGLHSNSSQIIKQKEHTCTPPRLHETCLQLTLSPY